jgi:hypothetical protein
MSEQNKNSVAKVGVTGAAIAAAGIAGHGIMAEKAAVKNIGHIVGPASQETSQVGKTLRRSLAPHAAEELSHASSVGKYATWAGRSRQLLSESGRVGQKLVSLRLRIPPAVYGNLCRQWQRNNAEIETCHQRLQAPELPSWERETIEERLIIANQKNVEIERLMEQYG